MRSARFRQGARSPRAGRCSRSLVAIGVVAAGCARCQGHVAETCGRFSSPDCSRRASRSSCSRVRGTRGGRRENVRSSSAPGRSSRSRSRWLLLGEHSRPPLVTGAAAHRRRGGFLLASERERPEHVRCADSCSRSSPRSCSRSRDNLVRWLSVEHGRVTWRRRAGDARCGCGTDDRLRRGAHVLRCRARDARAFAPAGVLLRTLLRLPVRGLLPRARARSSSPLVATESLCGVTVVARAAEVRERGSSGCSPAPLSSSAAAC